MRRMVSVGAAVLALVIGLGPEAERRAGDETVSPPAALGCSDGGCIGGQEMAEDEKVILELRRNEALVLHDLLSRWGEAGSADSLRFEHQAEQRVLWDIDCLLERQLAEPFMPDYPERLAKARREVQDPEGTPGI